VYQIGLFATGRGQGSRQLLQAVHQSIQSGRLRAKAAFVFCNREPGEFDPTDGFLQMVREMGYPLVTHSFRKVRARLGNDPGWRAQYDAEVVRLLAPYNPDLCVLAGYLLIWSHVLCRRYTAINLHPAAPGGPIGMVQDVIWQLIESKARASGNMMFHVTEELDRGPIVSHCTFPLTGGSLDEAWRAVEGVPVEQLKREFGEELPLFQFIRRRGLAREKPLVVETIRAFAEGAVRIENGRVLDRGGRPFNGLDLTAEIEAAVRASGETA